MALTGKEIQKNKLDMQYRAKLQEASIFLTLGTITIMGFIAVMFVSKSYITGGAISFLVFIIAMVLYKKSKKSMKEILNQLDKLE